MDDQLISGAKQKIFQKISSVLGNSAHEEPSSNSSVPVSHFLAGVCYKMTNWKVFGIQVKRGTLESHK